MANRTRSAPARQQQSPAPPDLARQPTWGWVVPPRYIPPGWGFGILAIAGRQYFATDIPADNEFGRLPRLCRLEDEDGRQCVVEHDPADGHLGCSCGEPSPCPHVLVLPAAFAEPDRLDAPAVVVAAGPILTRSHQEAL